MGFLNKLSKISSQECSFYPSKINKCVGECQSCWLSVAVSATGKVQAAISLSSDNVWATLWASEDAGASWETIDSKAASFYSDISLSSDGKTILFVLGNQTYYAHNCSWLYGMTTGYCYNNVNDTLRSAAMSSDGKIMAVLPGGWSDAPNQIYISTNSGTAWSAKSYFAGAWSAGWIGLEMSDDGSIMVGHGSNARVITSSDTGNNWVHQYLPNCPTSPIIDGNGALAITSNGMCIRAVQRCCKVYASNNSGSSWFIDCKINFRPFAPSKISMSSDGCAQVLSVNSGTYIMYSPNYGSSWFNYCGNQTNDPFIQKIAMSKDGKYITIAPASGFLMTNTSMWTRVGQDNFSGKAYSCLGWDVSINCLGNIIAASSCRHNCVEIKCYDSLSKSWLTMGQSCLTGSSTSCFGNEIELSADGCKIIIGAKGTQCVQTYCYNSNDNIWQTYGQKITGIVIVANNGQSYSEVAGCSVSINSSGNIIAIGYPGYTFPNNPIDYPSVGKVIVYCYQEYDNTWVTFGDELFGNAGNNLFGFKTALNGSGNILAVGAPGGYICSGVGGTYICNAPRISVFCYSGQGSSARWCSIGQVVYPLNCAQNCSSYGGCAMNYAMSLDLNDKGDILIGGYPLFDSVPGSMVNNGAVGVYSYNSGNNSWIMKGNALSGIHVSQEFGWSVSINGSGNIIAVGADQRSCFNVFRGCCSCFIGSNTVYGYNEINNTWEQMGQEILSKCGGKYAGTSIDLNYSGDKLVTSIPFFNGPSICVGLVNTWEWSP
jgi:hypothetical protein